MVNEFFAAASSSAPSLLLSPFIDVGVPSTGLLVYLEILHSHHLIWRHGECHLKNRTATVMYKHTELPAEMGDERGLRRDGDATMPLAGNAGSTSQALQMSPA